MIRNRLLLGPQRILGGLFQCTVNRQRTLKGRVVLGTSLSKSSICPDNALLHALDASHVGRLSTLPVDDLGLFLSLLLQLDSRAVKTSLDETRVGDELDLALGSGDDPSEAGVVNDSGGRADVDGCDGSGFKDTLDDHVVRGGDGVIGLRGLVCGIEQGGGLDLSLVDRLQIFELADDAAETSEHYLMLALTSHMVISLVHSQCPRTITIRLTS